MARRKVEIMKSCGPAHPNLKLKCLVCKKKLECDSHTGANGESIPCVYGGVVFRSSGQFGSRVLDCGVGIPYGWENDVQIIVCDECLVKNARTVNAFKDKRTVIERRAVVDVPAEWSEYSTFAELRKAANKQAKEANARMAKETLAAKAKRPTVTLQDWAENGQFAYANQAKAKQRTARRAPKAAAKCPNGVCQPQLSNRRPRK